MSSPRERGGSASNQGSCHSSNTAHSASLLLQDQSFFVRAIAENLLEERQRLAEKVRNLENEVENYTSNSSERKSSLNKRIVDQRLLALVIKEI